MSIVPTQVPKNSSGGLFRANRRRCLDGNPAHFRQKHQAPQMMTAVVAEVVAADQVPGMPFIRIMRQYVSDSRQHSPVHVSIV